MKAEKKTQFTLMLPKSLVKEIDELIKKDCSTRAYLMRLFIIQGVEREKAKIKLDN